MSLTSSIANTSASTTSVNVARLTTASMSLISSSQDAKTGIYTSVYRLPTGDSRYPLTLTLKYQDVNGVRRCSATVASFVKIDDSITGLSSYTPCSLVVAFNMPSTVPVNTADVGQALANAFGVLLGTVTTGTPDWKVVANLLYGVPTL